MDDCRENPSGDSYPPNERICPILVIDYPSKPNSNEATKLMGEEDNSIEGAHEFHSVDVSYQS